jgi:hypothetical protein
MNDQFLGGINRRSKNSFERKRQEYRRRARYGRQRLLPARRLRLTGTGSRRILALCKAPQCTGARYSAGRPYARPQSLAKITAEESNSQAGE